MTVTLYCKSDLNTKYFECDIIFFRVRVAQRTNPVVCMAETVILTLNALVI